jgi:hypothetical protein
MMSRRVSRLHLDGVITYNYPNAIMLFLSETQWESTRAKTDFFTPIVCERCDIGIGTCTMHESISPQYEDSV